MARALTAISDEVRAPEPDPGVELSLLATRIRPPSHAAALVSRARLIRRLVDSRHRPVALVVAPAGYGKTTLLSEWVECDGRPFAWVALTAEDNDPARLLSAVALALDGIEPVGWEIFEALSSGRPDAASVALQRLVRALSRKELPFVLVLDDLQVLRTRGSRSVLEAIWQALPAGSQLALGSRADAGLPLGRLRAQGSSIELRSEDLAMTRSEAAALLRAAGLEVGPQEVLTLVRRTDGWPAGLYLAALALSDTGRPAAVDGFAGDDRFVTEFVREELLAGLRPRQLEFLTCTSVLDRLSAPLCDALLGRDDSAAELEAIAHANVPLVALDRSATAYRYNPLFAEVLRAELRLNEPGREAALHRRASACLERLGDTDGAVRHAIAARDLPRAGRLLWGCALDQLARGRADVVWSALERFADEQIADTPLLALVAAGGSLTLGDCFEAERWTALAAGGQDAASRSRPRDPVEAGVAVMRAWIGRGSISQIGGDATRALALLDERSAWRPLCRFLQGVAAHLDGDLDAARARLEEAGHRAAASAPMIQALCLAQLALVAAETEDVERANVLASRARAQVERSDLHDCPAVALVFSVSSALRARRAETAAAAGDLQHALALLARFTDPSPWYEAECRIELSRAAARLHGPAAATELLAPAETALRRVPDAPLLARRLTEARGQIEVTKRSAAEADWTLTTAELRVLRYLPSHLSFREIAERLFVSPNTVKTHARAIYRKLDVSSRGKAVDRARGAGLVEPAATA